MKRTRFGMHSLTAARTTVERGLLHHSLRWTERKSRAKELFNLRFGNPLQAMYTCYSGAQVVLSVAAIRKIMARRGVRSIKHRCQIQTAASIWSNYQTVNSP